MAKGGEQPKQETKYELSPEQRELMNLAMPGLREFSASVPQRYQGSTVAGFTPEQTSGQQMALGAAPAQNAAAAGAARTHDFYTSDNIWDPKSNPNLQGAIDAAVRPVYTNLTEKALPAIRSGAISGGNFGSNRQGVAESQAIRDAGTIAADTSAKIAQGQYQTNVDAQMKAIGLTPTVQGAQTVGATTTSGVGDVRQAMDQALLNQNVNNFNWQQYAPFLQSKEILSLLQGMPGGTTVSTGNSPAPNQAMQALGGAAAGASLGTAIMPGIGTGVGAGAGALLPFLFPGR